MELELASINPYLAELPSDTQKEIKQKIADRMFAQSDPPKRGDKLPTSGTSLDIIRVLTENLKVVLDHLPKK